MALQLPPDYSNEIRALDREISKAQPSDILQFCANFFLRRLESQRAEFLLQQHHSSAKGSAMAGSTFPGTNPFNNPAAGGTGGMHSVREEDEDTDTIASPTASGFPPNVMANSNDRSPPSNFGNFAGFNPGGGPLSSSRNMAHSTTAQPPASDQGGDAPNNFPTNYNLNRRTSVSAESLAPTSADDKDWKPPYHQKSSDQQSRLRAAVASNFLFTHLDDDQTSQVLGALKEKKCPSNFKIIEQGDAGDYFYVVENGSFDIYVNPSGKLEAGAEGLGKKVATSGPGTSFGELALMYNAPRAATVISTEAATVWQLDRITFRRILMDSAFQRRRMYEDFLNGVPLLASLTAYERSKIADALETVKYPANKTIIREGDVGDRFYILEDGAAEVFKAGTNNNLPLKTYQRGDYFGELALLDDKPRAASVVSKTDVKVAMLGKAGFQRLLGPVEGIMRRDDPSKR
ncbi:hypothetical protein LTR66_004414 [Elasticomyces elasticus]|nr:hypothetical protein LTR66_004414 [Elasticomyces elasticus]